jgi:hypothetical protein
MENMGKISQGGRGQWPSQPLGSGPATGCLEVSAAVERSAAAACAAAQRGARGGRGGGAGGRRHGCHATGATGWVELEIFLQVST